MTLIAHGCQFNSSFFRGDQPNRHLDLQKDLAQTCGIGSNASTASHLLKAEVRPLMIAVWTPACFFMLASNSARSNSLIFGSTCARKIEQVRHQSFQAALLR